MTNAGVGMSHPTARFLEELDRQGHHPVLEELTGTIRLDLRDEHGTEHWYVTVKAGDVQVSRDDRRADCVVHADRRVFDQMVTGQLNQWQGWLRNLYTVEGNGLLFRLFANVFPGPAGARHPYDLYRRSRKHR